jgi:hypothetical protein
MTIHWIWFAAPLLAFPLAFGAARIPVLGRRRIALIALLTLPLFSLLGVFIYFGAISGQQIAWLISLTVLYFGIPIMLWGLLGGIGYDVGRRTSRRYRESRFR